MPEKGRGIDTPTGYRVVGEEKSGSVVVVGQLNMEHRETC